MRAKEFVTEVELAWARSKATTRGGSTSLKFRCTTGPRKSRTVSHPSDCYDHPNIAQSQRMKTTRARTAPTQARRQQRTKSINTASKLVKKLNKHR